MKKDLLFPYQLRFLGWSLFIPFAILGLLLQFAPTMIPFQESLKGYAETHTSIGPMITNLTMIGLIVGLLLIAFSRERVEDEMIQQLCLQSLQWSIYANYLLLVLAIVFFYGLDFLNVMIYNLFTILVVFIIRFRWTLYKNERNGVLLL